MHLEGTGPQIAAGKPLKSDAIQLQTFDHAVAAMRHVLSHSECAKCGGSSGCGISSTDDCSLTKSTDNMCLSCNMETRYLKRLLKLT